MGARGKLRMRREIAAAEALGSNPHVMPVLDSCPSFEWFVMPCAEATAEQRRADLQAPEKLRAFVDAIASALAEAHRTGWLHRDIKPTNILLLNGHWRLADWGIVRRPRGHTTELLTKERIGTEEFAAPELSVTPHEATSASDLYSLGQVIGWVITGSTPRANIPLLPAPGHMWYGVVRRLTQLDPLERPQDVATLLELVDRETVSRTEPPHVRAKALLSLAATGDESAGQRLLALAADAPENYAVYIDGLAGLSVESVGPALVRNTHQAGVVLRALAKHAAGNGTRRNTHADADRAMSWLLSVSFYAEQGHRWQLLDESMRAMCRWDAAYDRRSQQETMRIWLSTLSGQAAAIVAAILRDQPDSAKRFRVLSQEAGAHVRLRADIEMPEDQSLRTPPAAVAPDLHHNHRTRPADLPDALRSKVLTLLYQQADQHGWLDLNIAARSALYNRWATDPAVGEVLLPYFESEHRVRTWMKDYAMRTFSQALEGRGPTADYAPRTFRGVNEIAEAACGAGWTVDLQSVTIKPDRFIATNGDKSCFVVWGSHHDFRHLAWAAMNAEHEIPEPPVVVVTSHRGAHVNSADITKQQAIAQRSGIRLVRLIRDLHPRADSDQGR